MAQHGKTDGDVVWRWQATVALLVLIIGTNDLIYNQHSAILSLCHIACTSTGEEAKSGTAVVKGASGSDSRKHTPMTIAVSPVRPPASTPAKHSPSTMTGEQPSNAAKSEPKAQQTKT